MTQDHIKTSISGNGFVAYCAELAGIIPITIEKGGHRIKGIFATPELAQAACDKWRADNHSQTWFRLHVWNQILSLRDLRDRVGLCQTSADRLSALEAWHEATN